MGEPDFRVAEEKIVSAVGNWFSDATPAGIAEFMAHRGEVKQALQAAYEQGRARGLEEGFKRGYEETIRSMS